jgi:short-subunit dehydrogenase
MADRDRDLTGKVVVITGASSGFGKGAARKFAERGASLVLAARRDELLDELRTECEGMGAAAIAVPTDVSDRRDMEKLAEESVSRFGRVDVWVNNAGAGALGLFEEIPLEDHEQVIGTTLLGALYGSWYAMRQFKAQGSGILINIASIAGKVPHAYYSSYVAAKHGVVGLSSVLRQELDENEIEGVHVCTVMPGAHDTPFFQHAANYTGHESVPPPPVYEPEKVVNVIVRLATDPEDEVVVGRVPKVMAVSHNLMPGVTEKMMGREAHKTVTEAAPESPSDGTLLEPQPVGSEVSGGWKNRDR